MKKQTERVELTLQNRPGVLDRIVGHIRREGWNIKSISVDVSSDPTISLMEMHIEGTHTKLALILDKLVRIDCVLKASMEKDGQTIVRERALPTSSAEHKPSNKKSKVASKPVGASRILTINPGSTSTKFGLYDDEQEIFVKTVRHNRADLEAVGSVFGQKELRLKAILEEVQGSGVELKTLDAIAGRGGLLRPIESGTYRINDAMIEDLSSAAASVHASALGALIANDLAHELNIPAYVVDPIVVDEMDPCAKITGLPGVERSSIFHALNQKAIARRLAGDLGRPYENLRMVVAHLGGGITVGAHRYGRVIDVNDALSGEGPFTPERTGNIPAVPLIKMCFSGEYTEQELLDRVMKSGGMQSYLGTNNLREAQRMIGDGDEFAALVVDSMAYQVSKEIGAMCAVLEGRTDAIVLTGGLAYSDRFTGAIKEKVDAMAPVYVYPGEDEMLALMQGVLRVLKGQVQYMDYER